VPDFSSASIQERSIRIGFQEAGEAMQARLVLKRIAQFLSLVIVFLPGFLCGFGRISVLFEFFAQLLALVPGILGSFWRAAFYKLTLEDCSIDSAIAFGTFFSRRRVIIAPHVSIGSYCIIGQAKIGTGTQISSHVEIPGARQHLRAFDGRLSDSSAAPEPYVTIGANCWIGASAIVMADVGDQTTIGAGSVVVKDIPANVIAVGVPAKPIKTSIPADDTPQSYPHEARR
jgi:virginiamycin A acetyltransferase